MSGNNSSGPQPQRTVRLGASRHAMPASVKRVLAERERYLVAVLEAPSPVADPVTGQTQDQIVVGLNAMRAELVELRAFVKATS